MNKKATNIEQLKQSLKNMKNYTNFMVGDLSSLKTNNKNSLVDAINEIIDRLNNTNESTLSLNYTTLAFTSRNSVKLIATGATGTIKWSSSDTYVAKVTSDGVVTANNNGDCIITATCGDKMAKCNVTVSLQDFVIIEPNGNYDSVYLNNMLNEEYDYIKNGNIDYTPLYSGEMVLSTYTNLSTRGDSEVWVYPINKTQTLDLTNFNTLKVQLSYQNVDNLENSNHYVSFRFIKNIESSNELFNPAHELKITNYVTDASFANYTLDISKLSGNYYFGIQQYLSTAQDAPGASSRTFIKTIVLS